MSETKNEGIKGEVVEVPVAEEKTPTESPAGKISSEEAMAALRAEEEARYQRFSEGIDALSKETGYGLSIEQGIVIKKLVQ